jgi:hypothetical protein
MRPTLTFTDYIENTENGKFNIEIIGTINGPRVIKAIARPIPVAEVTVESKAHMYRRCLDSMCLSASIEVMNSGIEFLYPRGMNLSEKLALYDIKQTVSFNNSVHASGQESTAILAAIW